MHNHMNFHPPKGFVLSPRFIFYILSLPQISVTSRPCSPFVCPTLTPLCKGQTTTERHIAVKGAVVESPNLSFEIPPLYRFWENRDVILHVKSIGKIACVGIITELKLKLCHCCELSSYCYLNDYQGGSRYTLEIWRQSRLTSHFRNQIKRFDVLETSCSWLSN